MTPAWRQTVQDCLQEGSTFQEDAPLAPLTTLRIGGPADLLVEVEGEGDLVRLAEAIRRDDIPYWVLGKGSNVLVPDVGVRALVIRLGKAFRQFHVESEGGLAWGGAALANATFVEQARAAGLGGMEFLVTIPGSLGGAVAMNAGAFGGETAGFLKSVRSLDLRGSSSVPCTESATVFSFAYRHSPLRGQAGRIVLAAAFLLVPSTDAEIQARKESHMAYRRNTQPREFPNCGSVFKNPPGQHAARLIEEAGLKGYRVGGAEISGKHANFIVNRGNASFADVVALIDLAQRTVYHRTQIRLEPEVQVVEAAPPSSALV